MIIDTHIHLDDERYRNDLEEVLKRAGDENVSKFIIPGADPETLPRAVEISEKHESVYFAVGVHPYDAINYDRKALEKYIIHEKCVAVGECGLDYYRLPDDEKAVMDEKRLQKDIFLDQIDLAKKYEKPLIIHIRDASRDSQEILEKSAGERGGVLHCYNADRELLKLSGRGFYFGIGGVVTFKNAKRLLNILPEIPMSRVLIETDGPYLTPHPYRGERNEPAYCRLILQKIAQLYGRSDELIEDMCRENTKKLFGI